MAATPTTAYTPVMAQLTGNTNGALQNLPAVTVAGARDRVFVGQIALAAQAAGTVIGIARLPIGAIITDIRAVTDTSLGTATIEIGDAGNANSAKYAAAQTLTAVGAPVLLGNPATMGVPITAGFDGPSGLPSQSYEDVTLTVGTAALPGAGNLTVIVKYAID